MTWIIFSMLGYLYKIVPFLYWTYKYSEKVGKENVPMLKDMMNENLVNVLYVSFTISVLGMIVSVAFQSGPAAFVFLGIQALASILYAGSIIRVLFK
jgi:Ca2+/Na+ antiporter